MAVGHPKDTPQPPFIEKNQKNFENCAPLIEFPDGGAPGLNLLPWIEKAAHLLVLDSENLTEKVNALYARGQFDSPGVVPADFASVFAPAAKEVH